MNRPRSRLRPRDWVMGCALAATIAATVWSSQIDDEETAVPVAGNRRTAPANVRPSPAEAGPAVDWSTANRQAWAPVATTQLAAWSPPPPPPPPAPPPPPPPLPPSMPVAPMFPYQLVGRLVEGETALALLAGPTRSAAVRVGDVVDGQWRVDEISPNGLVLTWLPAQLKQNIVFRPS